MIAVQPIVRGECGGANALAAPLQPNESTAVFSERR